MVGVSVDRHLMAAPNKLYKLLRDLQRRIAERLLIVAVIHIKMKVTHKVEREMLLFLKKNKRND